MVPIGNCNWWDGSLYSQLKGTYVLERRDSQCFNWQSARKEYEACHSQEEKESRSPEGLSFIIIREYQKPQIKIRIILKVIIFSVCYFDFTQTLSQYKSKNQSFGFSRINFHDFG